MGERRAIFATHFVEDLEHWVRSDRKVALRLLRIVRETLREPFAGVGKPLMLGLAVFAVIGGTSAYFLTLLAWRVALAIRIRRRRRRRLAPERDREPEA